MSNAKNGSTWSRATDELKFDGSTPVFFKGSKEPVYLVGTFIRSGAPAGCSVHHSIAARARDQEAFSELTDKTHAILNAASAEKYPYDMHYSIPERVEKLGLKLKHVESERQKLIMMVSERDAKISDLKTKVKGTVYDIRNAVNDLAKKTLAVFLDFDWSRYAV